MTIDASARRDPVQKGKPRLCFTQILRGGRGQCNLHRSGNKVSVSLVINTMLKTAGNDDHHIYFPCFSLQVINDGFALEIK